MNHTPLSWYLSGGWVIRGTEAELVAEVLDENVEANADFIVTAVNCHDDLLEACEALLAESPKLTMVTDELVDRLTYSAARRLAEKAIAKAKGEK
uniref:Uncharacterized protein n=1 Tax=viral metagenome TaxID=1070528 RepID=A0A6M3LXF5_9ZZZZ